MSKLRNLRVEAGLSASELSRRARVSRSSIEKMERGEPVRAYLAGAICRVLSEALGRTITYREAEIPVIDEQQ